MRPCSLVAPWGQASFYIDTKYTMKKRLVAGLIVFLVLVAGIAIFTMNRGEQNNTDDVTVRLKWLHQSQFAGYYVAEQEGFYKEEGLNVRLIPGGAETPSIQIVAGGSEQFGISGMAQLIEARKQGIPVVALATTYRKNPLIWFGIDESIQTPQDLVGKKVGLTVGSNSDLLFRAMLKKNGVDIEDINIVPVKYDLSLLLERAIDMYEGYLTDQPISAELAGYKTYILNPSDYGIYFYGDTLFTTEKMIQEYPDLVRRFTRATLKGWQFAYDNSEKAVDYVLMYSDQLNREQEILGMKASLELIQPDDKPIGTIEMDVVEQMQDLLVEYGIIESPIDLDTLIYKSF